MNAHAISVLCFGTVFLASASIAMAETSGGAPQPIPANGHLKVEKNREMGTSIFDRWGIMLTLNDCTQAGGKWNAGNKSCGPNNAR